MLRNGDIPDHGSWIQEQRERMYKDHPDVFDPNEYKHKLLQALVGSNIEGFWKVLEAGAVEIIDSHEIIEERNKFRKRYGYRSIVFSRELIDQLSSTSPDFTPNMKQELRKIRDNFNLVLERESIIAVGDVIPDLEGGCWKWGLRLYYEIPYENDSDDNDENGPTSDLPPDPDSKPKKDKLFTHATAI